MGDGRWEMADGRASRFGISDFGFVSDFGFRISDFCPVTRHSTLVTYFAYAHTVSRKKNALNTSLRSETQATDSTCSGCSANRAATSALRHSAPVIRLRTRNNSRVLVRWNPALARWCAPARWPKSWQSRLCESHVS